MSLHSDESVDPDIPLDDHIDAECTFLFDLYNDNHQPNSFDFIQYMKKQLKYFHVDQDYSDCMKFDINKHDKSIKDNYWKLAKAMHLPYKIKKQFVDDLWELHTNYCCTEIYNTIHLIFSCKFCDSKFYYRDQLTAHTQYYHGESISHTQSQNSEPGIRHSSSHNEIDEINIDKAHTQQLENLDEDVNSVKSNSVIKKIQEDTFMKVNELCQTNNVILKLLEQQQEQIKNLTDKISSLELNNKTIVPDLKENLIVDNINIIEKDITFIKEKVDSLNLQNNLINHNCNRSTSDYSSDYSSRHSTRDIDESTEENLLLKLVQEQQQQIEKLNQNIKAIALTTGSIFTTTDNIETKLNYILGKNDQSELNSDSEDNTDLKVRDKVNIATQTDNSTESIVNLNTIVTVEKKSNNDKQEKPKTESVNSNKNNKSLDNKSYNKQTRKCKLCRKFVHKDHNCKVKYKNTTCYNCFGKGHIQKFCHNKFIEKTDKTYFMEHRHKSKVNKNNCKSNKYTYNGNRQHFNNNRNKSKNMYLKTQKSYNEQCNYRSVRNNKHNSSNLFCNYCRLEGHCLAQCYKLKNNICTMCNYSGHTPSYCFYNSDYYIPSKQHIRFPNRSRFKGRNNFRPQHWKR